MPETIEDDLEERIEGIANNTRQQQSIGDVIHDIDKYISQMDEGELTFLTPINVQGLEEAFVYQQYVFNTFGWVIPSINELIRTKLIYTKSIEGRMIAKKIEALSVLQAQLNAHVEAPSGWGEKLMGIDNKG